MLLALLPVADIPGPINIYSVVMHTEEIIREFFNGGGKKIVIYKGIQKKNAGISHLWRKHIWQKKSKRIRAYLLARNISGHLHNPALFGARNTQGIFSFIYLSCD